ncbi:hypothetical protein REPUB_Repub02eG0117300 [Reevesia pubescens]
MNNYLFGSNSPKSFNAYPRCDFDIESGIVKRIRSSRNSPFYLVRMIKSLANRLHYYYKLHPLLVFFISLVIGVTILIVLLLYEHHYRMLSNYRKLDDGFDNNYPFAKLKNLVMVAGHSVYTSSSCGNVDKEDSWFLESYQKNPGQAATFLANIKEGMRAHLAMMRLYFCLVVKRLGKMLVLEVKRRVIGQLLSPNDGLVCSLIQFFYFLDFILSCLALFLVQMFILFEG